MWIPSSVEELEEAVRTGAMVETPTVDFKERLPPTGKNVDLAIDVTAMTADGGVLIYGVGEDDNGRPSVLQPFELAGARERIDQITQTSISEPPEIDVRPLEFADDPSRGYLVVVVPQSPRAPHQVTVGGEMRFYCRGATGNRKLTEGEVARLYARRNEWEVEREEILDLERPRWSELMPPESFGFMYAFARPVDADVDLLERAARDSDTRAVLHELLERGKEAGFADSDPGLSRSPLGWFLRGAEGWELRQEERPRNAGHLIEIHVDHNGSCHLFCDRAAETLNLAGVIGHEQPSSSSPRSPDGSPHSLRWRESSTSGRGTSVQWTSAFTSEACSAVFRSPWSTVRGFSTLRTSQRMTSEIPTALPRCSSLSIHASSREISCAVSRKRPQAPSSTPWPRKQVGRAAS